MKIDLRVVGMSMCCALAFGVVGSVVAAPVADLQADYDAHTHVDGAAGAGIVDSDGTGTWDYYFSDALDFSGGAPTLDPMTYTTAADSIREPNMYIGADAFGSLPGLTSEAIFSVQPAAAPDELALHPGQDGGARRMLWVSWTSGITGVVDVTGWVHNISSDGGTAPTYDGVDLSMFDNSGSLLDSYIAPHWAVDSGAKVFFDGDMSGISVNAGDKLYFRVSPQTSWGGDNSAMQIQITEVVPEPSSLALLGCCLVGLIASSRRRCDS